MGKLNYSARKIEGLKAGQVLSKDLKKRIPPGIFSKAAARDPTLEIDIAAKDLTDEGFALFIDDLIECIEYRDNEHPDGIVRLAELHLQGNILTACSLKKLGQVVALSAGDLRELDLSDNQIDISKPVHRIIWQGFLESFKGCYVLKKLDLSHNPLGPRGLEILARVYMRSDLDFLETDVDNIAEGTTVEEAGINERVSSLTLAAGKENEKPKLNSSKRSSSKGRSSGLGRQSLSAAEKAAMQADLKRYACTRGLRSIPYLIISNVSMTNASAVHLSSMLSTHRTPEQLLAFLPGGKALTLPDMVGRCKGIIWLPNRDLGPLAHKLLDMAEMFREVASDADSDEEYAEESSTPSKVVGQETSLATESPFRSGDITKQRQVRKKMDIEYVRLTKRVRIEVLRVEGVHSADIWSTALKMMVTCRALLFDDRDRHLDTPAEELLPERSAEQMKGLEDGYENGQPDSHTTSAAIQTGRSRSEGDHFTAQFPALPGTKTMTAIETPKRPPNDPVFTPPSRNHVTHSGSSHARTSPGTSPSSRKEIWRFGLSLEIWRQIIADAVGAEGILDREQQLQIIRYASDWNALAYELTIRGAADHQQIWKFLDTVNCFTYQPPS